MICLCLHAAQAQGFYTKAGGLGAGLGYFSGLTDHASWRIEATTANKFKRNFTSGTVDYQASLDANQAGIYVDIFPFGSGLRLSGGMQLRQLQAWAKGQPNANGQLMINNTLVALAAEDTFMGHIKFPSQAPYVGIGWGYHMTQKPGLGLVLDLGASFGKPSIGLKISDSLHKKLRAAAASGIDPEEELQAQQQKLVDTLSKYQVFPQVYLGVSYRFH